MVRKIDMANDADNFEAITFMNEGLSYEIPTLDGIEYGYDLKLLCCDERDRKFSISIGSVSYFRYVDHSMMIKKYTNEGKEVFAMKSNSTKLMDWIRGESLETSDYFQMNHIKLNFLDVAVDMVILGDPNISFEYL